MQRKQSRMKAGLWGSSQGLEGPEMPWEWTDTSIVDRDLNLIQEHQKQTLYRVLASCASEIGKQTLGH